MTVSYATKMFIPTIMHLLGKELDPNAILSEKVAIARAVSEGVLEFWYQQGDEDSDPFDPTTENTFWTTCEDPFDVIERIELEAHDSAGLALKDRGEYMVKLEYLVTPTTCASCMSDLTKPGAVKFNREETTEYDASLSVDTDKRIIATWDSGTAEWQGMERGNQYCTCAKCGNEIAHDDEDVISC